MTIADSTAVRFLALKNESSDGSLVEEGVYHEDRAIGYSNEPFRAVSTQIQILVWLHKVTFAMPKQFFCSIVEASEDRTLFQKHELMAKTQAVSRFRHYPMLEAGRRE